MESDFINKVYDAEDAAQIISELIKDTNCAHAFLSIKSGIKAGWNIPFIILGENVTWLNINIYDELYPVDNDHILLDKTNNVEAIEEFEDILNISIKKHLYMYLITQKKLFNTKLLICTVDSSIQMFKYQIVGSALCNIYNNALMEKMASHNVELLGTIAHKIRTPLNSILHANVKLKQSQPDFTQTKYISAIDRGSLELVSTLTDMIDLIKIDKGIFEINNTSFNLIDLIKEGISIIQHDADKKNIFIKTVIGSSVPTIIISDETRVKQILINLLTNAVKYSNNKGIIIIEVNCDEYIEFTISDTGIGINEYDRENILNLSVWDQKNANRINNTGFGLPLSKHIAQLLGGNLRLVKSEVGKGSVFAFSIMAKEGLICPNKTVKKFNVLIVEDEECNQEILKDILDACFENINIGIASNGQEALDHINNGKVEYYNLLLVDLKMPIMNGVEFTNIIRGGAYGNPTIIGVTAQTIIESSQKEKFDDFIFKPIDIKKFKEKIEKHMSINAASNNEHQHR